MQSINPSNDWQLANLSRNATPAQLPSQQPVATDRVTLGSSSQTFPAVASVTASVAPAAPAPAAAAAPAPPVEDHRQWIPSPKNRLFETPTVTAMTFKLAEAYALNQNVLLTGETGAGKTAVVKHMALITENPLRRANMDGNTDEVALFGGYKPGADGSFKWVDGVITSAIRNGHWLLLDEINLADPAVLERINPLMDGDGFLVLTEKEDQEKVMVSEDTRIFATMNPASYAGRKELSAAMFNRFQRKIWADNPKPAENAQVLKEKFPSLPEADLLHLALFQDGLAEACKRRDLGKKGGPYTFTLRDMLKIGARVERAQKRDAAAPVKQLLWKAAQDVYQERFMLKEDREAVDTLLQATFGAAARPPAADAGKITKMGSQLTVGRMTVPYNTPGGAHVPTSKARMPETKNNVLRLERVLTCVENDEPALLVGPTSAGKTSIIRWAAHETNNEFRRVNLSNHTDTSQLIGGWYPMIDPETRKPVAGKFEWRDGVVVEAMKKGQWLVLDEINLADPAVLERLNSLLDPDRALVLTEHEGEKVEAHANFRVFATMNPATAEYAGRKDLSPAMRNRFTELWTPAVEDPDEMKEILTNWMANAGMRNADGSLVDTLKLADKMVELHGKVRAMAERGPNGEAPALPTAKKDGYAAYTLRDLRAFTEYVNNFVGEERPDPNQPGKMTRLDLARTFVGAARAVYSEGLRDEADRQKVVSAAEAIAQGLV